VPNILIQQRKWVKVGRRIALATPECLALCCGGCPLWRLLALCDTTPRCDGSEPPVLYAWICATVTCTDGSPLNPGRVVSIDGLCWTVQIQQVSRPPIGDHVIQGLDPVQCVSGCDDPACPTPTLWFPGQRCGGGQTVYFCGIAQCGIYRASQAVGGGCYRVDPSGGGVVLPPNAITSAAIAGPFVDCCSCENVCRVCPLVTGAIDDPTCFGELDEFGIPVIFSRTCCRSARACYRVDRMIGTQTFDPAPFEQPSSIVNEWFPGTTGPDGVQNGYVRNTRIIEGVPLVTDHPYSLGGCGLCPVFPILPDRDPMSLTFTEGTTVPECRSSDPSLTVTEWGFAFQCGQMTHRSAYRYDAGGRIITTTFVYEASIIDDDDGVCAGRCVGRGVSAERRKNISTCAGCGAGQQRTLA